MILLLTRDEAARALALSEKTVQRLEARGLLLPVHPTGSRAVRYRAADIRQLAGVTELEAAT